MILVLARKLLNERSASILMLILQGFPDTLAALLHHLSLAHLVVLLCGLQDARYLSDRHFSNSLLATTLTRLTERKSLTLVLGYVFIELIKLISKWW
jgi:hypothetical protein